MHRVRRATKEQYEMTDVALHDRVVTKVLASRAMETPDKLFIDICGTEFSYGECHRRSMNVGRALASLGVGASDRVVVMLPNRWEFVLSWFGTAFAGAAVVPVNPEWKGDLLTYLLEDADPVAVVIEAGRTKDLLRILEKLPRLVVVIVVGDEPGQRVALGSATVASWSELERIGAVSDVALEASSPRFDDVLAVLYSSGTTGRPKGIVMSHAHICSFALQWIRATSLVPDDIVYLPNPIYYMQATVLAITPTLLAGARIHLVEKFSASRYWADVRRFGATLAHAQFSLIPILLKQPPSTLDREHRCTRVFIGKTNREFEERFGVRVIEIYGSTEVNIVAYNPWEAHKEGSAGLAAPNFEVKIFDEDDQELPGGEIGEIVTRPREPFTISYGYLNRPDVWLGAWRNMWFHCGDRGYFDADGYLFFVDRIKDMIRRKGENISSEEVERQLNAHPAVLESAAVPVPAETAEDEVKVFVVLRTPGSVQEHALVDHMSERVPRYMVPRYVEIVDALPKTGSLKIEKYRLRQIGVNSRTWDALSSSYVGGGSDDPGGA
jgi:crotonobetaine/carnitine-CoA ligase